MALIGVEWNRDEDITRWFKLGSLDLNLFKNTLDKLQFGLIEQKNKQLKYKIERLNNNGEVVETLKSQDSLIEYMPNGGKIMIE